VAHYVPVFAPFYGHILNNFQNSIFTKALQTPSSQRSIKCWFRGRISYAYDGFYKIHAKNPTKGAELYGNTSTAEYERKYLRKMKEEQGLLQDCIFEERPFIGPQAGHDVEAEYERYIQELSQAAFSLCPAGNNPETFRLHEVSVINVHVMLLFVCANSLFFPISLSAVPGHWNYSDHDSSSCDRTRFLTTSILERLSWSSISTLA
jgi:hypothetical protein